MKAVVLIDGRSVRVEFRQSGETYHFRVESQEEKSADIREVEPGLYSVLLAGRSYEAVVETGNSEHVSIAGRRIAVEVADPRRWSRSKAGGLTEGRQNIAASMPGKVVRVLVAEGDMVEAGQGLVVVEAMKMQNEMKAARSGRVVAMKAVTGATVNAGEILAAIE
jgi:biotin carboxyl carrier protein